MIELGTESIYSSDDTAPGYMKEARVSTSEMLVLLPGCQSSSVFIAFVLEETLSFVYTHFLSIFLAV